MAVVAGVPPGRKTSGSFGASPVDERLDPLKDGHDVSALQGVKQVALRESIGSQVGGKQHPALLE